MTVCPGCGRHTVSDCHGVFCPLRGRATFRQTTEREVTLAILKDYRRANDRGALAFTPKEADTVLGLAVCAVESSHINSEVPAGAHCELGRHLIAAHNGFRERKISRLDWGRLWIIGGVVAFCAAVWYFLWKLIRRR